jgi:lipase chaperone LimK
MAEALYQFTNDVHTLERIVRSSPTVADTYGRLRQVRDHRDHVDTLLDAQAHTLRALDQFESTARDVVLAAHAEHAAGERANVVSSLLDLQAEALIRRDALATLDDAHLPEPPTTSAPS